MRLGIIAIAAIVAAACASRQSTNTMDTNWITLFDGTSTSAWRGYLKQDLPEGWQVVDGALTRVGKGGDIITRETFDNFELILDWKLAPGGNSGVFFHVKEEPSLPYVWLSAPEYQILDDANHTDGKLLETSAGSNFAVHAVARRAAKKAGEWNTSRLIVAGSHVEHWLNGEKVVEYQLWSNDWANRVAASKFKTMPEYGKSPTGHIALQDHDDWVAYRNIRIRRIK